MFGSGIVGPGPRCVLPFTADALEVSSLRSAVRVQLVQWRVSALLDEAQLAVTELATNIVKHVGEGVVAALVMELAGARLRIELHDKSRTLPMAANIDCDSEGGRGLHLVALMADDSGAALSVFGKVVWCEFGVETMPDGRRAPGPVRASGKAQEEVVA